MNNRTLSDVAMSFRRLGVFVPRQLLPVSARTTFQSTVNEYFAVRARMRHIRPFSANEYKNVPVKVIDDRGNESLLLKPPT